MPSLYLCHTSIACINSLVIVPKLMVCCALPNEQTNDENVPGTSLPSGFGTASFSPQSVQAIVSRCDAALGVYCSRATPDSELQGRSSGFFELFVSPTPVGISHNLVLRSLTTVYTLEHGSHIREIAVSFCHCKHHRATILSINAQGTRRQNLFQTVLSLCRILRLRQNFFPFNTASEEIETHQGPKVSENLRSFCDSVWSYGDIPHRHNYEAAPCAPQVLLLERWMTMALAAHAADSGETKADINNTKRPGHSVSDRYHHPGQHSPRATSTATTLAGNKEHNAFRVALNRPSAPVQTSSGGVDARKHDANGTGSATTAPHPRTAAATDGVNAPGCRVPEGEGGQDDGATASSAEEEKKATKIRVQMSVLMVGFFEIIRQVSNVWLLCWLPGVN